MPLAKVAIPLMIQPPSARLPQLVGRAEPAMRQRGAAGLVGADHFAQIVGLQRAGDEREFGREHHDPGDGRISDRQPFNRVERDQRRDFLSARSGGDKHPIETGIGQDFDQLDRRRAVGLGDIGVGSD